MSATVSRAGSTRNKLLSAQPLSSLVFATVAMARDMSSFPKISIHAGDGCAPRPCYGLFPPASYSSAFLMTLISSTVAKPLYKP